ncbi:alpha-ketoglutarate-dependent dioxygenase AlkB [Rhizophagus clarus]|uniref:Alpha-ketoglutarate-dependent dioxygenase AlkB n=1 Tax=Rhizophagus clarus TaxID=94130 RepID=A0A8H3LQK7_9GLOM|nr:alpha-ketoglutarate-dependent dioxygenase AlkB [Rhizophagus clarus]
MVTLKQLDSQLSSSTTSQSHLSSLNAPIEGLFLIDDFISEREEFELINSIDLCEWSGNGIPPNPEMKRRTQHYGYEFSYRYRKVVQNLGKLPTFLDFLIKRFIEKKIIQPIEEEYPNMCIINEYQVGQGIMPHTDSPEIFNKSINNTIKTQILIDYDKIK